MIRARFREFTAAVLLPALFITGLVLLPASASALNADQLLSYFVNELTPYGDWEDRQPYGRVWRPTRQDKDWRPYSQGHWVYSSEYGWVWNPEEEWGQIPYHYGRWTNAQNSWFWVPDDTWGPAWVDWREDDDYIGWSPLPPEANWNRRDEWRPDYNRTNYSHSSYMFIPRRNFTDPRVHRYVVPDSQREAIYQRSRNVTVYRTVNQMVVNEGPRRELIERATKRKLTPVHYQPRAIRGRQLPTLSGRPEETRAERKFDEARPQDRDMKARLRDDKQLPRQQSRIKEEPRRIEVERANPDAREHKLNRQDAQVNRGRKEEAQVKRQPDKNSSQEHARVRAQDQAPKLQRREVKQPQKKEVRVRAQPQRPQVEKAKSRAQEPKRRENIQQADRSRKQAPSNATGARGGSAPVQTDNKDKKSGKSKKHADKSGQENPGLKGGGEVAARVGQLSASS